MIHALALVGVLLFLAPLAADVPLAVLAAILFVVAWNMSEARHFVGMLRRAPRADVVILLVTFGLTVFADLVVAVNIGVILAMLHFMRRMASSVEVRPASALELAPALAAADLSTLPAETLVYTLDGPFFFGAVENFERALSASGVPRVLVFNLRWVPFVDITALQTFEDAVRGFRQRGVQVLVAGANDRVQRKYPHYRSHYQRLRPVGDRHSGRPGGGRDSAGNHRCRRSGASRRWLAGRGWCLSRADEPQ